MAEAEDSSSFEDDNKPSDETNKREKNDNNSSTDATVSKSNPEVVASIPSHMNFFSNSIGESSIAPVAMDSETSVTSNDKFFHGNHNIDHPFRSSNPLAISTLETDETALHQVIELKEDDNLDTRPTRGVLLYSCHFRHCCFQAPDREVLTEHIVSFHNNGEREGKSNISISLNTCGKPKEFQCDLCQMKFTNGANMQRHRMSHLGVRPFECRICGKKFTRNDHLMEHLVRQHSKQRPYKCPFCIKSYSMKPSLKSHLASDHSGIPKDKVCRVCGFRATTVAGAKIHYTNTHLRNGSSTPSTCKASGQNLPIENETETPAIDLMEEMDLARVSQNFSFGNRDNVSVPTSTASFASETVVINHTCAGNSQPEPQSHQSSFRRYQATSSFLPLPLCSSSLPGSLIDPAFPGTSTMTDVSSSMRDKAVLFPPLNTENGSDEAPFLCTSSDLKQEPIDADDGHNSCSSSAGAQPTSTMDTTESGGPENERRLCLNQQTADEDDAEVGNHFAAQLRNPKTNNLPNNNAETSRRRHLNLSEEDDTSNQNEDRKPEINSLTQARSSKHEKRRNPDRKPCHRPHCCDAGESKVSTSVRNPRTVTNNDGRELPEAKPALACLHRKVSSASTVSNEQNSVVLSREATEPVPIECIFCGIIFPDRTLYYLHRGMHSDNNPWKCNMCGEICDGKYDFYAHVISREHR